jgi:hypothetical protein
MLVPLEITSRNLEEHQCRPAEGSLSVTSPFAGIDTVPYRWEVPTVWTGESPHHARTFSQFKRIDPGCSSVTNSRIMTLRQDPGNMSSRHCPDRFQSINHTFDRSTNGFLLLPVLDRLELLPLPPSKLLARGTATGGELPINR